MNPEFLPMKDGGHAWNWFWITVKIESPEFGNPFLEGELSGEFTNEVGQVWKVEGFYNSEEGSRFEIRFMPPAEGKYAYRLKFTAKGETQEYSGIYACQASERPGMVRVDPDFPFQFQYAGTKLPYFWNSTNAYSIVGWESEIITEILDRFERLGINRIRASLSGIHVENSEAWKEPVYPSDKFSFLFHPWVMTGDDPLANPGYDVTRFNLEHWRKFERLLAKAKKRGIQVSVIFYVDGYRP
ncbi:MAG: DUF5060 domain-containing protein, partial [Chthonomonadaceae bacterium]|nr:DUF5060 domain-containing protein [Chthonomonadaceae bacterium]